MNRDERATLQTTLEEVDAWLHRATAMLGRRMQILLDSQEAVQCS